MLESYREHVAARAALGIPPLPLTAEQTADLCELLKQPPAGEEAAARSHSPRCGSGGLCQSRIFDGDRQG
jgi:aconitase B